MDLNHINKTYVYVCVNTAQKHKRVTAGIRVCFPGWSHERTFFSTIHIFWSRVFWVYSIRAVTSRRHTHRLFFLNGTLDKLTPTKKRCQLEVGKMDEQVFSDEIWAIQPPCEVTSPDVAEWLAK